jgi:tetratricopeptide (TPR) repeat protein
MISLLIYGVGAVFAQEQPPPDPQPVTREELNEILQQMNEAADRAERAVQDAEDLSQEAGQAFQTANNMFGLFEAMSGAVGLVVPFLAVVAAFLGFRRLESAQSELREARERFVHDMEQRESELDHLRDELQLTVQKQREDSSRASLALSLLPLGERQYRAQDYTGALDTYRRALQLDPDNPIIFYRMGYVFTQSGELEQAEQYLTKSLELDPSFAPSQAALGYVYRRIGDQMEASVEQDMMYNKAEQNFLKALKGSPKLMDEDSESWWGSLGGLYRRRGQVNQAIQAYERCAEVTPHSSYPFSNLALLYMQTQDREKMLKTYQRVEKLAAGEVQAEVDNYWAYADLIVARLALGKVKETEAILETALETAPADSPYTLESLLDTLSRLHQAVEQDKRAAIERIMAQIRHFRAQRQSQLTADM